MENKKSDFYLKELLQKTNCKGVLLATQEGLCIHSEFSDKKIDELENITTVMSILISLSLKVSSQISKSETKELIIKNENDCIILKPFSSTLFLLIQTNKNADLDFISKETSITINKIKDSLAISKFIE